MIPKIIHITWKNKKDLLNRYINFIDGSPKMSLEECLNTFRAKNPDWEIVFHSDEDINSFVEDKYPNFVGFFSGLKIIEKVDLFRYMCLYEYGGLFLDTDCICTRPLNEFLVNFPDAKVIAAKEFQHLSNWINYPPHVQLNLWSIFSERRNHHIRNILSLAVGNCIISPDFPVIEKTSMAIFGDYLYKAAATDNSIKIVSESYLSLDGRFRYMHANSYGSEDFLPTYILHGYHSSWIDEDFKKYAEVMTIRDWELKKQIN